MSFWPRWLQGLLAPAWRPPPQRLPSELEQGYLTRWRLLWRRTLSLRRSLRRVRPTREGWVFLSTMMAVALAALNTGNNLLYLVLAAMLSLVAVSSLLSEWSIRGLRVSRTLEGAAFAGEALPGRWLVANPRGLMPAFDIRVEEGSGSFARLDGSATAAFLTIGVGESQVARANWCFGCRGVHRMTGIRISTVWPFGIFHKWYEVVATMDVLVFPARASGVSRTRLLPGRPGGEKLRAVARSRPGADGEFRGLSEHREGDDPRRIHWRSSARLGRLLAAEHAQERVQGIVEVIVDAPSNGGHRQRSDEFEGLLSVAAAAICSATEAGREVRLSLLGKLLPAAHSDSGRDRLLRALALVELPGEAV